MTRAITQIVIDPTGDLSRIEIVHSLPFRAKALRVGECPLHPGKVSVWFEVDRSGTVVGHRFHLIEGLGEVPNGLSHLGTAVVSGKVWHLYCGAQLGGAK